MLEPFLQSSVGKGSWNWYRWHYCTPVTVVQGMLYYRLPYGTEGNNLWDNSELILPDLKSYLTSICGLALCDWKHE
jgi:hypothetical protein